MTNVDGMQSFVNPRAKDIIKCQCGFKRSSAGKIVGGTVADDNTWPFMAALVYVSKHRMT